MNTLFNHYDSLSQWCGGCFSAICRINLKKGKSCQINSWQVWAQRKITIISWHDTISMPVLPISDAVHCIRSRKYLQPFPQALATVLVSTCRKIRLHLGWRSLSLCFFPTYQNFSYVYRAEPKKAVSYITTKQPRLRFRMGLNQRPHD